MTRPVKSGVVYLLSISGTIWSAAATPEEHGDKLLIPLEKWPIFMTTFLSLFGISIYPPSFQRSEMLIISDEENWDRSRAMNAITTMVTRPTKIPCLSEIFPFFSVFQQQDEMKHTAEQITEQG